MDYDEIQVERLVLDESFQRYCSGIDVAARDYWEGWLARNPGKRVEFYEAKELYFILSGGHHALNFEKDKAVFYDRLLEEGLLKAAVQEGKVVELPGGREEKNRFSLYRLFAAAAVLLAVVAGAYLFLGKEKAVPGPSDGGAVTAQKIDRAPGTNKATLTLADGSVIVLDSSASGVIAQKGGVKVINTAGLLSYQNGGESSEVLYNTIATPKGGQYQLLLADGSKVWLNASSSLRFPSAFPGGERKVELQGEGYFEVAHNRGKPFHVKVNDMDVAVLGTHFNVMAYADEEAVKTTLLEGKVRVQKQRAFVVLAPGQQAQVNGEGAIKLDKEADLEEAVAWKNGLFQFAGADMRTVMRHIGRWYAVETVLQGDMKNIHLSGKVSRNLNLTQVVQVLEDSGIDIKLDGNKMIASPKP